MKRIYISPTLSVMEVQYQQMLALSNVEVSSQNYVEDSMTDLTKSNGNFHFSWDDQAEE